MNFSHRYLLTLINYFISQLYLLFSTTSIKNLNPERSSLAWVTKCMGLLPFSFLFLQNPAGIIDFQVMKTCLVLFDLHHIFCLLILLLNKISTIYLNNQHFYFIHFFLLPFEIRRYHNNFIVGQRKKIWSFLCCVSKRNFV